VIRFLNSSIVVISFFGFLFLSACSSDDPVTPAKQDPDYFPYTKSAVWTYKTNVFKNQIGPDVTMQIKFDTASTQNGTFDWMMIRLPDSDPNWARVIGILDSAGVVYSIGDHPREELYPLFKHRYAESEIARETITVQGKIWQTVKVTLEIPSVGTVRWWFADGVGLVREHSMEGVSLFSDSNDDEVLTELVSYTK
jgi:hypothetical protein